MKNTPPGPGVWGKMKRNPDPQKTELSLASDLSFLTIQTYLSKSKLLIITSKQYFSGSLHPLLATSDKKYFKEDA